MTELSFFHDAQDDTITGVLYLDGKTFTSTSTDKIRILKDLVGKYEANIRLYNIYNDLGVIRSILPESYKVEIDDVPNSIRCYTDDEFSSERTLNKFIESFKSTFKSRFDEDTFRKKQQSSNYFIVYLTPSVVK